MEMQVFSTFIGHNLGYIANYADNAMNSLDYWTSVKSSKFYISPLVVDPDESIRGWKVKRDVIKES